MSDQVGNPDDRFSRGIDNLISLLVTAEQLVEHLIMFFFFFHDKAHKDKSNEALNVAYYFKRKH